MFLKFIIMKFSILLVLIELFFRCMLPTDEWYKEAERLAQSKPIRYIFIGSSRVACSINPAEFIKSVGDGRQQYITINMGRGYSTLVEHCLGVTRVAEAMPDKLNGVVVFLEAPQGLPDLQTWQNSWFHADNPELLAATMRISDLAAFWPQCSGTDLKTKMLVSAGTVSEAIRLRGGWKMLLDNYLHPGRNSVTRLPTGGIRQDSQGIQGARRLASVLAENEIKNQREFNSDLWNRTVLKSLNEQIRSAGGRLVLFTMPMSSIQMKIYSTDTGKKNKKTVARLLGDANIPLLEPVFTTTDDDFPDLWHLSGTRSTEFTRSIAQVYLQLKKM
jgi:hypothetical protein